MSLRHTLLLSLPVFIFTASSHAASAENCVTKQRNIETQIQYAQQHGNHHQMAGLQTALDRVKTHCTDADLAADRQDKVKEKQAKVLERQQDLREAQASGKAQKIAKQQKKLTEAEDELRQAQSLAQ